MRGRVRARRSRGTSTSGLLADYVGTARRYHHTAPISMLYALHAGLGVLLEEGLEDSWARHRRVGGLLQDALPELGFTLFAQERRLPQLTSVWLPDGVDDAKVRGRAAAPASTSRSAAASATSRARAGASA